MTASDDVLHAVTGLISQHIDRHSERVRASFMPSMVLSGRVPAAGSRVLEIVGARGAPAS